MAAALRRYWAARARCPACRGTRAGARRLAAVHAANCARASGARRAHFALNVFHVYCDRTRACAAPERVLPSLPLRARAVVLDPSRRAAQTRTLFAVRARSAPAVFLSLPTFWAPSRRGGSSEQQRRACEWVSGRTNRLSNSQIMWWGLKGRPRETPIYTAKGKGQSVNHHSTSPEQPLATAGWMRTK